MSAIELYTWATPNGRKVSIMLEELGLAYNVHRIDISKGEQHQEHFLAISPNNRIPAIIDPEGPEGDALSLFESGAILVYLAEKTGSDLLPSSGTRRARTFEWLMWQMGGVGPMFGQAHHFLFQPKQDVPYGKKRYHDETRRLYKVMNGRLEQVPYLAGDDYSIADVATYPWIARHPRHQVELEEFPAVKRWYDGLSERPAVQKGMAVPFLN
ncbi:MAG: glutathione S-transferase N-terminal domain-containing protein [Gammaproteobacteria bacterium]|nr:glutathione S-transferase N-terminal domain-containing protein [Gammaproteobacteria bacterium]